MKKGMARSSVHIRNGSKNDNFFKELVRNKVLYLMAIPGLVFFAIFSYFPYAGMQIAFKDYNFVDGIWKSPFVGLKNFEFFLKSGFALPITLNTLYLNFLFLVFGFAVSLIMAILINEMRGRFLKRYFQSALFLPHFLSWIIISAFVYNLLNERYGMLNTLLGTFGVKPVAWYNAVGLWRGILTILSVWQGSGFTMIIFLAVITSIDVQLYESAKIDGARRINEILNITIPHLIPTVVILMLLAAGKMFYGNFGMIYPIVGDSGPAIKVTDVIDTYVFRLMKNDSEFSLSTAIGLYQSVLGFILVVVSNKLVKKFDDSMGLF